MSGASPGGPLDDSAALDAMARMLSAPRWPRSGLDDIARLVTATGRTFGDDRGVVWDDYGFREREHGSDCGEVEP